jgi:hypothetical protein
VNSENRAKRLRQEVEKRLGASATHQSTSVKTVDEMLTKAPKRTRAEAEEDTEFEQALLRDPEAKSQKQGLHDLLTVRVANRLHGCAASEHRDLLVNPVFGLLLDHLDWERRADDGEYQAGIRPDFDAVRRLLNLTSTAS